jgi:hypothetical protein
MVRQLVVHALQALTAAECHGDATAHADTGRDVDGGRVPATGRGVADFD